MNSVKDPSDFKLYDYQVFNDQISPKSADYMPAKADFNALLLLRDESFVCKTCLSASR